MAPALILDSCCDPAGFLLHRSRASLRRPQCFSLREGSNTRSTCRFRALITPIRANIVGPPNVQGLHCRLPFVGLVLGLRKLGDIVAGVLQRDELAPARHAIGSSNLRFQPWGSATRVPLRFPVGRHPFVPIKAPILLGRPIPLVAPRLLEIAPA
jgi:hypothetical protein